MTSDDISFLLSCLKNVQFVETRTESCTMPYTPHLFEISQNKLLEFYPINNLTHFGLKSLIKHLLARHGRQESWYINL
jgi:hypothetical protein